MNLRASANCLQVFSMGNTLVMNELESLRQLFTGFLRVKFRIVPFFDNLGEQITTLAKFHDNIEAFRIFFYILHRNNILMGSDSSQNFYFVMYLLLFFHFFFLNNLHSENRPVRFSLAFYNSCKMPSA